MFLNCFEQQGKTRLFLNWRVRSWYYGGLKVPMKCFSGKLFGPLWNPQPWFLEGCSFKFGQKSKIFGLRYGPKLLPHQNIFSRKSCLLTNLTAKKKFWGWDAHPGPAICLKVPKCGISWFLAVSDGVRGLTPTPTPIKFFEQPRPRQKFFTPAVNESSLLSKTCA